MAIRAGRLRTAPGRAGRKARPCAHSGIQQCVRALGNPEANAPSSASHVTRPWPFQAEPAPRATRRPPFAAEEAPTELRAKEGRHHQPRVVSERPCQPAPSLGRRASNAEAPDRRRSTRRGASRLGNWATSVPISAMTEASATRWIPGTVSRAGPRAGRRGRAPRRARQRRPRARSPPGSGRRDRPWPARGRQGDPAASAA